MKSTRLVQVSKAELVPTPGGGWQAIPIEEGGDDDLGEAGQDGLFPAQREARDKPLVKFPEGTFPKKAARGVP
jgi:hypothetical protein